MDGTTAESDRGSSHSMWQIGAPVAVTSLAFALITWRIAFNLGAYAAVFYDDIFAVLVASSVLLVTTVVNRPFSPIANRLVAVVLAAPILWFVAAVAVHGSTDDALEKPVFAIALGLIAVTSVPLTLRLLIKLFHPELAGVEGHVRAVQVFAIVVTVAIAGFVFGANNHRFMNCSDFRIAGAHPPDNCVEG